MPKEDVKVMKEYGTAYIRERISSKKLGGLLFSIKTGYMNEKVSRILV